MSFSLGRRASRVLSLAVRVSLTAVAAVALAPGAASSAPSAPSTAALLRPVDVLVRGIDARSAGTIASAYVFAPTIVDEFAPFRWSGGAAAAHWYREFSRVATAAALEHIRVIRHAPSYVAAAGGRAWLVVPTDYLYDVAGKAARESAAWTFVLVSGASGWRIEASTWAKTAGAP
jgi:hypothetical protein